MDSQFFSLKLVVIYRFLHKLTDFEKKVDFGKRLLYTLPFYEALCLKEILSIDNIVNKIL
jgi:hypothetical protein